MKIDAEMATKEITLAVLSPSMEQQRIAKKKADGFVDEMNKLYDQKRTRESIIRNAVAPRTLRSGKVFDSRRCSALRHISALTTKGAGFEHDHQAILEEDEDEQDDDGEEDGEEAQQSTSAEISVPESQFEELEEEAQQESELEMETVQEIEKDDKTDNENIEDSNITEKRIEPIDQMMSGLCSKFGEQSLELNRADEVRDVHGTVSIRKQRTDVAKKVKVQRSKQKKRAKKRAKPVGEEADGRRISSQNNPFVSPPKVPCPKHPVLKAVHWADEGENAALFEVKEFREEKPRRRCTMFHKING